MTTEIETYLDPESGFWRNRIGDADPLPNCYGDRDAAVRDALALVQLVKGRHVVQDGSDPPQELVLPAS